VIQRTPEQATLFNLAKQARKNSTVTTLEGFLLTEDGRLLLNHCQEAMGCSEKDTIFLAASMRRKLSSLYRLRRSNLRLYHGVVDEFRLKLTYYGHWSGVQVAPGSLSLLLAVLDGSYAGQREEPPAPQPESTGAKTQRAYYSIKGFVNRKVGEVVGGYKKDAEAWHEMVKMVKKGD